MKNTWNVKCFLCIAVLLFVSLIAGLWDTNTYRISDSINGKGKYLGKSLQSETGDSKEIKEQEIHFEELKSPDESWESLQFHRKQTLKNRCDLLSNGTLKIWTLSEIAESAKHRLKNLWVDDVHKAIYCYIPKIACTEWKKMMMLLTGVLNAIEYDTVGSYKIHYQPGVKSLADFNKNETLYRLKNFTKFIFVRHPLERLLSAYKNKFVSNTSDAKSFKVNYARNMMKFSRNSSDVPSSGDGMKFEEFLTYLSAQNHQNTQEHWAPYIHLCHPCSIDYNYIGKYENLEYDSNQILKRINAPSIVRFPNFMPSRTSKDLQEIQKNISKSLFIKVFEAYKPDWFLFGYTW